MAKPSSLFQNVHSTPEVIREVELLYVQYPLSLRNVKDHLFERAALAEWQCLMG